MARYQFSVGIFLFDCAKCRGRSEKGIDLVLRHNPPKGARIRRSNWLTFVQDRCGASEQRCINDVGMTDNPADVTRRPEHLTCVDSVDIGHAPRQGNRMPTVIANDSLWLTRGTGGVKNVERVGCLDADALMWCRRRHRFNPVMIYDPHGRMSLGPLKNHRCTRLVLGKFKSLIKHGLVLNDARAFDSARRRDHDCGGRIINPNRKLIRGEPTEYDGMHRAKPGGGQHRDDRLGHHRHVDDDPISRSHTE